MIALERAVAHGHARATVKDYWRKREATIRGDRPVRSGRNDLKALHEHLGSLGFAVSGPSPDGPVH